MQVGAFDRVDQTPDPGAFATWMARQRTAGADPALDLLAPQPGDAVLDLGCGTGADLAHLAPQVRMAIGVDISAAMLAAAREAAPEPMLVAADGHRLPFRSSSIGACLARAVLIHCPEPCKVLDEITRALSARWPGPTPGTRPRSHLVTTSEQAVYERILAHRRSSFRNPLIGRALPSLATNSGLTPRRLWTTPIVRRTLSEARASGGPFDLAVNDAVSDGAITMAERDRYISRSSSSTSAGPSSSPP